MRDLPAPRLELVDDPRPACRRPVRCRAGGMSRRWRPPRASSSGVSCPVSCRRPRPTRTGREEEEVRSQGAKEDAAAGQLARLSLDQRAQVRAGDLVVAARRGGGARRRRRARANRGVIGTTDRRAAVAQLLAVIGPRVAHVCCAASRRSVNAMKFKFGTAKDCAAGSREKLVMPGVAAQGSRCVFSRLRRAAPVLLEARCGL